MWTYDFFKNNQTNQIVFFRVGLIIVSVLILIFFLIAYLRNKSNSKYRDLLIIFVLTSSLLVAIQTGEWQQTRTGLNNSSQVLKFFKGLSKSQRTNVKNISVSQQSLSSGMLVKLNNNFYRVQFNNDSSINSYELVKTNLIDTDINYVK